MRPGADIDRRGAARWEIAGALFVIIIGGALHFVFEWSGGLRLIAPFVPVNESIWEHLKMAFWPALLWMLLEQGPLRGRVNNFPLAKTAGILVMTFSIALLYYAYTAVLGHHLLALDGAVFAISVAAGHYLSYRMMTGDERSPYANRVTPILLIIVAVLFVVFTFMPPHVAPFMDGPTGAYGIPESL